jgi:hypothetical protein
VRSAEDVDESGQRYKPTLARVLWLERAHIPRANGAKIEWRVRGAWTRVYQLLYDGRCVTYILLEFT